MSYRSERFNRSILSLETCLSGCADLSKAKILSDRGKSAARMFAALDYDPVRERIEEEDRERRREELLFAAEMRLADAGKSHLIRVLLLIVENGSDHEESLKHVPRRTYFRHRDELLKFFCGTRVHMDI